jgi:hypothetical protein
VKYRTRQVTVRGGRVVDVAEVEARTPRCAHTLKRGGLCRNLGFFRDKEGQPACMHHKLLDEGKLGHDRAP